MMRLIWCWSQISINATKKWRNDIFFHSLLFLTFKYKMFSSTSGYPYPYQVTILIFIYALKKVWVNILSGAAMMERPDLSPPIKVVIGNRGRQWDRDPKGIPIPGSIFGPGIGTGIDFWKPGRDWLSAGIPVFFLIKSHLFFGLRKNFLVFDFFSYERTRLVGYRN